MGALLIQAVDLTSLNDLSGGNYNAGIVIAVFILLYLIYTLLKPEKF